MKQKLLLIMLILITGTGAFELNAQSIIVKKKDGTEYTKELSSVQKFYFSSSNLLVNYTGSISDSYSLADISKIYFKGVSNGITTFTLNRTISIYPNPVKNIIYIKNLPNGTSTIYIYRMDGSMVLNTQISSNNKFINLTNLASGLYLLKVNDQVLKFIKL